MGATWPSDIGTGRVRLRTWRVDDVATLAALIAVSIEHLRPWMPWVADEPLTEPARRSLIESWEHDRLAGDDALYAVLVDDEPVGGCGLHRRIGPAGIEVGYWIAPAWTRRGLASAATALLTAAAFADPAVQVVEVHHDKANEASAGVPRRLGFAYVGEVPDEVAAPGEVGVEVVWRMRRSDWRVEPA